jgi:hypothetical protein
MSQTTKVAHRPALVAIRKATNAFSQPPVRSRPPPSCRVGRPNRRIERGTKVDGPLQ